MTANSPNNPRMPNEADLLAWVEGDALSPEANAAVARALLADPALARRMELMRSDRAALRSLGEERAPGGLMGAVESALQPVLERELLLGLREDEPAESHPVVSMVRPEKRGIFQTFLADRAGRRMALAASLLVLIGGATWWATVTLSGGTRPAKVGPVAMADPRKADAGAMEKSALAVEPTRIEDSTKITMAPERDSSATGGVISEIAPPAPANAEAPVAVAELVGPVKTPMDAGLAAELARERKLVIRVVSSEAATTPSILCDRIRKEATAPGWKLAGEVAPELTLALDARPLEVPRGARQQEPEPTAFAGAESVEPLMGPPAPREIPVIEGAAPPSVYVFQTRLDAATMSQLKATLEKAGRSEEVTFEERYEALPLQPNAPILVPQAALWWSGPPSGWTSWGEVPVVIEPR